ncbi:MAG: cytochrome c oxidase assembly protein [Hyphomicrobiaceae bacterium]|nr:cytochrome c oxidase assembly protein [Hyphomicrobiaceae bacterium]
MPDATTPYCGAAPVPGSAAWTLDPVLIACLVLAAGAHYALLQQRTGWRPFAALIGWLVVALALVSPLCNLSVALFSARVGQHMVIALIGAPLIALGLPCRIAAGRTWGAVAAFAAMLWLWHMPGPYGLTFTSTTLYWGMHLSTFGAALWLWTGLLGRSAGLWTGLAASFVTATQMSLLGALLTFSPKPLFAVHLLSTLPWGLTPLEDQHIGGLIMWVPTGLLLVAFAVAAFGSELARLDRRAAGAKP